MNVLRTFSLWLALGGIACVQLGCGRPTFVVAQYAGPVQPRETLGIVRVNGDESLELLAMDDEPTSARVVEDARLHIEVLPGKHTVFVQDSRLPNVPSQRVRFVAEAGKVYRPVFVQVGAMPSARVYEVDSSSDALLRDVSILDAPSPQTSFEPAPPASRDVPPAVSPPPATPAPAATDGTPTPSPPPAPTTAPPAPTTAPPAPTTAPPAPAAPQSPPTAATPSAPTAPSAPAPRPSATPSP